MLEMPAQIMYRAVPADWEVTRAGDGEQTSFTWWEVGGSTAMLVADAYRLRDVFFNVKTPEQAEAFLKMSGPFRAEAFSVLWRDFRAWKEYFLRQRTQPARWGPLPEPCSHQRAYRIMGEPWLRIWPMATRGGSTQVTLLLECDSVVEAIAAANYLDRRMGVTTKTCPGCGDPFQPATARGQTCGKRCTHLLGQRRRRTTVRGDDGKA